MGMADTGTQQGRTARALLWDDSVDEEALAQAATLVVVGYKAFNALRHRRLGARLEVDRLFDEARRQVVNGPAAL